MNIYVSRVLVYGVIVLVAGVLQACNQQVRDSLVSFIPVIEEEAPKATFMPPPDEFTEADFPETDFFPEANEVGKVRASVLVNEAETYVPKHLAATKQEENLSDPLINFAAQYVTAEVERSLMGVVELMPADAQSKVQSPSSAVTPTSSMEHVDYVLVPKIESLVATKQYFVDYVDAETTSNEGTNALFNKWIRRSDEKKKTESGAETPKTPACKIAVDVKVKLTVQKPVTGSVRMVKGNGRGIAAVLRVDKCEENSNVKEKEKEALNLAVESAIRRTKLASLLTPELFVLTKRADPSGGAVFEISGGAAVGVRPGANIKVFTVVEPRNRS